MLNTETKRTIYKIIIFFFQAEDGIRDYKVTGVQTLLFRSIMIADTIDAMTTDRPYRTALTLSKAIEELERYSGTQFDPALVRLVSQSPGIRRLFAPERGVSSPAPAMPLAMSTRPAWAQPRVR